jgi:hypothetical protein
MEGSVEADSFVVLICYLLVNTNSKRGLQANRRGGSNLLEERMEIKYPKG